MTRSTIRDVRWGIQHGLWFGAAFSCIALVQFFLGGERAFESKDTTFLAVVIAYLAGGAGAGGVAGLFRSWTASPVRRVPLAVGASIPVYLALRVALRGFQAWERSDTLGLIVMPVIWGLIGWWAFRDQ